MMKFRAYHFLHGVRITTEAVYTKSEAEAHLALLEVHCGYGGDIETELPDGSWVDVDDWETVVILRRRAESEGMVFLNDGQVKYV